MLETKNQRQSPPCFVYTMLRCSDDDQVELEDGEVVGYVSVMESGTMQKEADAAADKMKRKASKQVRHR